MNNSTTDVLRKIRELEKKQQRGLEKVAELTGQLNHLKDQLKKGFEIESVEEGEKLVTRLEKEIRETEKKLLERWDDYENKYGKDK